MGGGGIFNNRILFENNRLLFSGNFCQRLDGGGQSHDGGILPVFPTRENPVREHLVSGTFSENLTRNRHLSFIFHWFLRHLRRTIVKCTRGSYFIGSIVLGKNKQVKICLPMSTKLQLCALNHLTV